MCLKINCDRCDNAFDVIFFKTMYNKTIIRFGFCDIRNNQGRGKCYQPKPNIIPDITKTSSNNCLLLRKYPNSFGMFSMYRVSRDSVGMNDM